MLDVCTFNTFNKHAELIINGHFKFVQKFSADPNRSMDIPPEALSNIFLLIKIITKICKNVLQMLK